MDKKEYVKRLAIFLHENGTTMAVPELAKHLNRNQFKTNYGSEFEGGRGTYKLVEVICKGLSSQGQQTEAGYVAKAFPKPDGSYAFKQTV